MPEGNVIRTEEGAPSGEAEKVLEVERLCWTAGMSAPYADQQEYDRDRYNKFRAKALRLADTLTDGFFRSGAIHFIIEASMKAGDEDDARALLKQVTADAIRGKIIERYPQLSPPPLLSVVRQG